MTYDNTNKWTLNKVAESDKRSERSAAYKGKINIDGKLYWLDGWIKDGPKGKFISGTVKAAEYKADPISTGRSASMMTGQEIRDLRNNDMDDDIPF